MRSKEGVAANPSDLANEILVQWVQIIKSAFPTGNFVFSNVNVKDLNNPATPSVNFATTITGTGTANSAIIPFCTFEVRLLTDTAGKKGRGRMYISTPNAGNITGGFLTGTTLAFFNNICVNLMARYGPAGTANYQLVLFGKNAQPGQDIPVVSMFVDTKVRVQRRRNIGVGA